MEFLGLKCRFWGGTLRIKFKTDAGNFLFNAFNDCKWSVSLSVYKPEIKTRVEYCNLSFQVESSHPRVTYWVKSYEVQLIYKFQILRLKSFVYICMFVCLFLCLCLCLFSHLSSAESHWDLKIAQNKALKLIKLA